MLSDMETSQATQNELEEAPKKSPFDNLSHGELIKKCKGLLAIAQKAKQARDAGLEENRALKEEIVNFEQQRKSDKECLKTMQEMVDSLTEYKLQSTIIIDDLKKKIINAESMYDNLNKNNKLCEEKLTQLDTENLSYKRQVARLTDENDKLLQELDILEKASPNQFELEKRLKNVLEENEMLRSEKLKIGKEITALTSEVEMKTEETIGIMKCISDEDDLQIGKKLVENLQAELNESRNHNITLKCDIENLQIKLDDLEKQLSINSGNGNMSLNESKILELEQALQSKCNENESLVENLNKSILEISELKPKLTELEILQSQTLAENEKLQGKIKNLELEYDENNKLIQNLKVELSFQVNKLTSEKDEAACKVKKAEMDTSKEQQNKQNLEKRIDELNKTITDNAKRIKELQKQKTDLEQKNKDNIKKIEKNKTENDKQVKIIDELKHQLGESYNSKRQLEDELNKLNLASKQLEDAQIVEKDIIIKQLETTLEEMKSKIVIADQEINAVKSNYDKLNENYESLSLNKEKLISKLKMYHHKLTEFASNLKQLKSDKNMLLETMKDYIKSISDWQTKISTISTQLCEKLFQCNIESKMLHERISILEAEKEKMFSAASNEDIQSLEQLDNENIKLSEQIKAINEEQVEFLKTQLVNYEADKEMLNMSNYDLLTKLQVLSNDNSKMSEEIKKLLEEKTVLEKNTETLNSTVSKIGFLQNSNSTLKLENEKLVRELEEMRSKFSSLEPLESEIINIRQQLSNKTSENKELLMEMREINEVLKQRGETISKQQEYCGEMEKKVQSLENEIKQLGFKLNDKDSQLNERHTQVQESEHRIKEQELKSDQTKNMVLEKDAVIQTLQEELNKMKDKFNNMSSDCQSDVLSTSTISKLEESNRFKDVDSSLEERYSKMRMLALKFKKKITEQSSQITALETEYQKIISERNETSGKISTNAKNMQILQQEYDKLQDELEDQRAKYKTTEKSASALQDEYNKLKLELDAINEKYSKSQSNVQLSKKEKSSSDIANKEYKSLIYNLKKNLDEESQNSTRQQEEINKLQEKLKSNELQITEQTNNIKALKDELIESKKELKRKSVLNLEMDNYEKTLNDVTKKLEARNSKIKELESAISSNSDTISSLKEQIKLLEANLESEVSHSKDLKERLNTTQSALNESEQQNSLKETEISELKRSTETLKAKVEELGLDLTSSIAEKEIYVTNCKSEKDSLLRQTYEMENTITMLTENLNKCKNELMDVKADFSSYKVRAQSVLRQNQFKDVSKEDELLEEIKLLTANNETITKDLNNKNKQLDLLNKEHKLVQEEKDNTATRCNELLSILEELRIQHDMLLESNQKLNIEHQETIKAQKLQNDTLVSCYKQQITELQEQNKKLLDASKIQLEQPLIRKKSVKETYNSDQKHIEHTFTTVQEDNIINIALMERGDGEGSESTHSISPTNAPQRRKSQTQSRTNREIIPLDELLNSSMSDNATDLGENEDRLSPTTELHNVKQNLNVEQSRVKHLTGLLAENEQDLAKLTQLNEVLKEEIRRSQRSAEREKHTQNSEYLKNVIFKFVTLSNGDERTHLVPVLNMLLKLSPEETQKLQDIAKGIDSSAGRGWGTYLPRWSNQP